MRFTKQTLAVIFATTIIGTKMAWGQGAIDRLQPLVETTAQRLSIARQVALAKWDSGAAVEDRPRETQVIASAVRDGDSKGLDPSSVSDFFGAQIEANKVVQYSLLADWNRSGKAPTHARIDLVASIRPELDHIQTTLIAEMANTAAIRATATCRTDVAKAIGKYASVHKSDVGPLQLIALDRALAASCTLSRHP